jgi:hypothetical protein
MAGLTHGKPYGKCHGICYLRGHVRVMAHSTNY